MIIRYSNQNIKVKTDFNPETDRGSKSPKVGQFTIDCEYLPHLFSSPHSPIIRTYLYAVGREIPQTLASSVKLILP